MLASRRSRVMFWAPKVAVAKSGNSARTATNKTWFEPAPVVKVRLTPVPGAANFQVWASLSYDGGKAAKAPPANDTNMRIRKAKLDPSFKNKDFMNIQFN